MLLDNIKSLCAKRRISLSLLETETRLGKNTIYRWAKAYPSADKLKKVADYFGVTVDELLKEETVS